MSYILNALRKSEQERVQSQLDAIENSALKKKQPVKKKTSIWIAVLVCINIVFLAFMIWSFINSGSQKSQQNNDNVIQPSLLMPLADIKLEKTEKLVPKQRGYVKELNSIANQMNKLKPKVSVSQAEEDKVNSLDKPLVKMSETKQKIKVDQIMPVKKERQVDRVEDKLVNVNAINLDSKKAAIEIKQRVAPPLPVNVALAIDDNENIETENIPDITELSYRLRTKVPLININVFVYTENENERFIMLGMDKYVAGEMIKPGLLLKEIRVDSIVVEYEETVFKIKRQ